MSSFTNADESSSAGYKNNDIEQSAAKSTIKNPTDFLKQVIGKPVVVKLHSGVTYRGVLACLDGHLNIAMEQTEEYLDGQLKNRYGDCFIRGNNGKFGIVNFKFLAFGLIRNF